MSILRRSRAARDRVRERLLEDNPEGICRRCGLPGAATIGHIVPLSRGGTDEYVNLSLEHAACNYRAGNRPDRPRAAIVAPPGWSRCEAGRGTDA